MSRATIAGYPRSWWAAMAACAAAALLAAVCPPAEAQESAPAGQGLTVGAHLVSWHSQPGYNGHNPGLYLRDADGWTVGAYRNSLSGRATQECPAASTPPSSGQTKHVGTKTTAVQSSAPSSSSTCDDGARARWSAYAGRTFGAPLAAGLRAEITVGGITGYSAAPVLPLIAPSLAVQLSPDTTARAVLLPRWHPKQGATVVHLALERRL